MCTANVLCPYECWWWWMNGMDARAVVLVKAEEEVRCGCA